MDPLGSGTINHVTEFSVLGNDAELLAKIAEGVAAIVVSVAAKASDGWLREKGNVQPHFSHAGVKLLKKCYDKTMRHWESVEKQYEEKQCNLAPDLKVLTLEALHAQLERLSANAQAWGGGWSPADRNFYDRIQEEIAARKKESSALEKEKAA